MVKTSRMREVENDEFGDVSEFDEPKQMKIAKYMKDLPTYVDAWELFSDIYEERDKGLSQLVARTIPKGAGAFEAWWLGKPSKKSDPDLLGPSRKITKEDIDRLAEISTEEICSLFNNCYYNNDLARYLDRDVLKYLIQKILEIAPGSDYMLSYLDLFFGNIIQEYKTVNEWQNIKKEEVAEKIYREIMQDLELED